MEAESEVIKGHDEIVRHAKALLAELPLPPGAEVTLPPRSSDTMGGEYIEYVPNKSLTVTFPTRPDYLNALGLVQGGFICAMFDNAFGGIGLMAVRQPMTTIDLHVEFLRPVIVGTVVTIKTELRKSGRSLVNACAEARQPNGKLLATASTNFLIIKM